MHTLNDRAVAKAQRTRLFFRDNAMMTYDRAFIDSAGVFLNGELERLDQTDHGPLYSVTWDRDIDLRTDVSIADEVSSFTNSSFGAVPGLSGSGKAWISKDANAITGVSVDIGKTPQPLNLWAVQIGWTIPELESAMKLGRPIDQQKYNAMQVKWAMDTDEQVYIGDAGLGVKGLLNHASMTNVTNAQTGNWAAATAQQMIDDVNEMVNSAWAASGYTVCPTDVRLPPAKFMKLNGTIVSTAGNRSVLDYLIENCIATRVNGRPINIQPLKWCTGTTAGGQGPGTAGADRMLAYTRNPNFVRFPRVPLLKTPLEYRDLRQLTTYYGRLGIVELVYAETIAARDGI